MEQQKRVNKSNRKKEYAKYGFILPMMFYPMLMFCIFYVYVNFNSILMAFQKSNLDGRITWVGLQNFKEFITSLTKDGGVLQISFGNSVKMYLINLVICMPLYIFFSYILFKKYKGHSAMRAIVMIPQVVSGMVICLLFKKVVDNALPELMRLLFEIEDFPVLLSDSRYSFQTMLFYMIWISFSTSLIVYANAMGEINDEIIESAHIDGVNDMFRELRYIILPLIYPTLQTFIVVGFAGFLTNAGPLVTFYETNAPAETYTVGYYYTVQIMRNNTTQYNMLAAGGLLMTLVVAPLTHLLNRSMDKLGPELE